jgi:hypothetical protein
VEALESAVKVEMEEDVDEEDIVMEFVFAVGNWNVRVLELEIRRHGKLQACGHANFHMYPLPTNLSSFVALDTILVYK